MILMNSGNFKRKKKQVVQCEEEQSSIHTLKTWMHQLEQHMLSVSARLHAIENRLALDIENIGSSQHIINQEESLSSKNITLDPNFSEKNKISKDYKDVQRAISNLQHEQQKLHEMISHQEKTSLKQAIIMRVGSKELPLEITGIIGGSLALLVAALIAIGGKDLVISPPFLMLIGFILIGSSLIRSTALFTSVIHNRSTQKKQSRNQSYPSSTQTKEPGYPVDSGNQ